MRLLAPMLALLTAAAPAAAQTPPQAAPDPAAEMARRMNDPATGEQLGTMMQSLAKSFLALPVGELQAAAEGRKPSASEKRMTVRDAGRREDPAFDRKFAAQMAATRPMIQQSLKALGQALPAMTRSLREAGDAVERAAANMPDPTYPKR